MKVFVRNNADYAIKIPLYHQLGCVIELPYKSCFTTSADLNTASTSLILLAIIHDQNGIFIKLAKDLEIELSNDIKIYGNKKAIDTITQLIDKYPSIWKFLDFVQISPKHWIKLYLKPR